MKVEKWDMKYRTKGFSVKPYKEMFGIFKHNKIVAICRDELEIETIFIVLCEHKIKSKYLYEYNGDEYTVKEIAKKVGVSEGVIYKRLADCSKMEDVFRQKGSRKGNKNVRDKLREISAKYNIPLTTLSNRWYLGERGKELTRPRGTKLNIRGLMYEVLHNI